MSELFFLFAASMTLAAFLTDVEKTSGPFPREAPRA